MSTFQLKTHRTGATYSKPHFFILNKGLNSGKPLQEPCANCFEVQTNTEADKNTLFYLSMMLQIGGFYRPYLKGSVIPFITIKDCNKVMIDAFSNVKLKVERLKKSINGLNIITQKEQNLIKILSQIKLLKHNYIQSCLK